MKLIFNAMRPSDHLPCVLFEIISDVSDSEGCEFVENFRKMAVGSDKEFFTKMCFEMLAELEIIRPLGANEVYELDWGYFGTMKVVNILSPDKRAVMVYIPTFDVVDTKGETVDLEPVLLDTTPEEFDEPTKYMASRDTLQVLSAILTASLKIEAGTSTVKFEGLLPYDVLTKAADNFWMTDFMN